MVVRTSVDAGVGVVTLDRPERLNAWTGRMESAFRAAIASFDADPSVRVIVVTGAGRGFCAGADSAALGPMTSTGVYDSGVREDVESGFAWLLRLSKPVIAAINGPAAGVGFVLALFCDLRFAVPGAKLTTSFGRLGLPAEYGTSWLLPRLVGRGRAADLLFSSRVVLAEEALTMGLVDRVCFVDDTLAYARQVAAEISPSSLRTIKQQLWSDLTGGTLDSSVRESTELLHRMVGEDDFKEGVRAMQEKRPPRFA
ncbi:MAG TPA: enoyl-CoA hydratase-related protein [Acidimicrobiales bacterium]|nr:enoyl-CoA hydratase-related protein [Acidimicrobiales bacterium]